MPSCWMALWTWKRVEGNKVLVVQQIIDADGGIEVFNQILAEEGEIDGGIAGGIRSGEGVAGEVRRKTVWLELVYWNSSPAKILSRSSGGADVEFKRDAWGNPGARHHWNGFSVC